MYRVRRHTCRVYNPRRGIKREIVSGYICTRTSLVYNGDSNELYLTIRYGGAIDGIEVMAVTFAKKLNLSVGTFVMIYNIGLYIICGIIIESWINRFSNRYWKYRFF
mgnify:CR=1 FL=1